MLWAKCLSHINAFIRGNEREINVKNRLNVSVVRFLTIPQPTACVVFEASRHRTAITGNKKEFVHDVSSTNTNLTSSPFETSTELMKNASTKTFDSSRWISEPHKSDLRTVSRSALDCSFVHFERGLRRTF